MTKLNCSDAAKMMIERMQTNPEDFEYGGRLYRVMDHTPMSARDTKAYNDAHDLYIKEPQLMAAILQALLVQPEDDVERAYRTGLGRAGTLGLTGKTIDKIDEVTNTTTVSSQHSLGTSPVEIWGMPYFWQNANARQGQKG